MIFHRWMIAGLALLALAGQAAAQMPSIETGGKLLLTRGISNIEGAGGGGIVPWALITGNETDRGIGGTAYTSAVFLNDFTVNTYGAAIGFYDRFELSYTRQRFDTRDAGAALGLGQGFTFEQDVFGAKLRLFGDAVYGQDSWLPQVAFGVQYKDANRDAIVRAVGARDDSDIDIYISATRIDLANSLVLNATLRSTRANQNGLLGFGGDVEAGRTLQAEFSAGLLVTRRLLVGVEYRFHPDNLGFAREDNWMDVFVAYAINDHVSIAAAYADLGSIATFDDQRGLFLSLQAGF